MPEILSVLLHLAHAVGALLIVGFYFIASVTGYMAWSTTYRYAKKRDAFVQPYSVYLQLLTPPGVRRLLSRFAGERIAPENMLAALRQFAVLSSFAACVAFMFLKLAYFANHAWTPPAGFFDGLATMWAHGINALALTAFHLSLSRTIEEADNDDPE